MIPETKCPSTLARPKILKWYKSPIWAKLCSWKGGGQRQHHVKYLGTVNSTTALQNEAFCAQVFGSAAYSRHFWNDTNSINNYDINIWNIKHGSILFIQRLITTVNIQITDIKIRHERFGKTLISLIFSLFFFFF